MAEHKTIPRRRPDSEGLDFDGLKAAGIAALQELCGATWTDYNLHDPGITVLEQLCYALTEIRYQAEFDVADYLAGPDGKIDFERQALYRPHDILPSQAVTFADYRKLIIDGVPGIDNVWLLTDSQPDHAEMGCYQAYIRLRDASRSGLPRPDAEWVLRQVREVYAANRNLCEDLGEVRIVARRKVALHGRIEFDGERPPAEILAQIYFRCARLIARGVEFFPYEEKMAQGMAPERLFCGPLTAHGYIDEGRLGESADTVSIVDLFGLIGRIEGVKHVDQLVFLDEQGSRVDSLRVDDFLEAVPYLHYPTLDEEVAVRLYKSGRPYPVSFITLRSELDRLHAEYRPIKRGAADLEGLSGLPTGVPGRFGDYHSIQHQFPALYGISAYGLPQSASPMRKAQAKQFKAYLLFFEQILANAVENLSQTRRLYSVDAGLDQTYFSRTLDSDTVPGVEPLYDARGQERDERVAEVLATYDDFGDRRNRVLDYLLGLHGEAFSQSSLRHFDHYLMDGDVEAELIRNKLRLIGSLVELSQRRAAAFNYLEPAEDGNRAILASKAGILLGVRDVAGGPATAVFRDRGLRLEADDSAVFQAMLVDQVADSPGAMGVRWRPGRAGDSQGDEDRLRRQLSFLREGSLSLSLLHYGIDLEHYRIAPAVAGFDLHFQRDDVGCYRLATCPTTEAASDLAHELRGYLVRLNAESERILVLEHILLRPRGAKTHEIEVAADFYPFRLSVIFPAWSARFSDEKFRNLAEETIRLNCPAHLYPEFHWLDFAALAEFEARHALWLAALRRYEIDRANDHGPGAERDAVELDAASVGLITFLLELGEARTT